MARLIAAENYAREDGYRVLPSEIMVDNALNTRLYEPDVSDLLMDFRNGVGQKTPCIGTTLPDKRVKLIAGYRRWLAGKQLEDEQATQGIPIADRFKLRITLEKNVSADAAFDINVGENANRKSLTPPERAHVIRRYREQRGWIDDAGTTKIAERLGCKKSTVVQTEKLLQLSDEHQYQLHRYYATNEKEGISLANAKLLIQVPEHKREELLEEARQATAIQSQVNEPPVAFPIDKGKSKGKKKSTTIATSPVPPPATTKADKTKANAGISSRTLADLAAKSSPDVKPKARTVRDVVSLFDEILDPETRTVPFTPEVKKMLTRMKMYFLGDPKVTAPMIDNSIDIVDKLVTQTQTQALSKSIAS